MKFLLSVLLLLVLVFTQARVKKLNADPTEKDGWYAYETNCRTACKKIPNTNICGTVSQSCCHGQCKYAFWKGNYCDGQKLKVTC